MGSESAFPSFRLCNSIFPWKEKNVFDKVKGSRYVNKYTEICINEPEDFDKCEDVNGHHLQSEPLQRSLYRLPPRICNMPFQSLNYAMRY